MSLLVAYVVRDPFCRRQAAGRPVWLQYHHYLGAFPGIRQSTTGSAASPARLPTLARLRVADALGRGRVAKPLECPGNPFAEGHTRFVAERLLRERDVGL